MEKKNIGIVTTWFERGAGYVSRQYYQLLKNHFNVFIYARGGEEYAEERSEWNVANLTWAKRTPIEVPTYVRLKQFKKWISANNLDVVFFNEQHWWPAVLAANECCAITGCYVDYYTEETVPFFENYDFLACNTKRHMSAFEWHPGARYIPWGTDIDLFKPGGSESGKELVFFHSAGMNPARKGTDILIRAFSRLERGAKLIVHSQIDLQKAMPKLRELCAKLMAEGRMRIEAKTVEAPGLYHLGDVYVYPARLDGIGLTVAEAQACGLPAIVTDSPPMNEFIEENKRSLCAVEVERLFSRADGYYWPQSLASEDDLYRKMAYMVENKERLAGLKADARAFAERNLNWKKNEQEVVELFRSAGKANVYNPQLRAQTLYFGDKKYPLLTKFGLAYSAFFVLKKIARKIFRTVSRISR